MERKYSVTYASGATGFGWEHEYDRISELEGFVNEIRHEYTVSLTVWDNVLKDFIFWKDCLSTKCEIDMLHSRDRDLRTTTRKLK